MRLTTFSDYTLRTLTYLALNPGRFVTISEVATAYRISSNHLMKVAHRLAVSGLVITLRGQHGGLRLARPASEIRIGDVIRNSEPGITRASDVEPLGRTLPGIMDQAVGAFMAVLDAHTIADLVSVRDAQITPPESDRSGAIS